MKALKATLYIIIGIVTLFLIIALFLPSHSRVERTIVINQSAPVLFNYVLDFNNYKKWNPWSRMDPDAKGELSGEPGSIGQKWSWDGEIVGKGSMTMVEIIPNKMIKSKLEFKEPFEAWSWDLWSFQPVRGGTKITWANEADLDYPVGRYFGLFYDGMMGPDFEKGLKNLKEFTENQNPNENEIKNMDTKELKTEEKKEPDKTEIPLKKKIPIKTNPTKILPKMGL
jgi:hypothetical protein